MVRDWENFIVVVVVAELCGERSRRVCVLVATHGCLDPGRGDRRESVCVCPVGGDKASENQQLVTRGPMCDAPGAESGGD